jgi:hypothetical protein
MFVYSFPSFKNITQIINFFLRCSHTGSSSFSWMLLYSWKFSYTFFVFSCVLLFMTVYSLFLLKTIFDASLLFFASLYLLFHCCSSHLVGCPSINFLLLPAMSICYSQHELMLKGTVHRDGTG